MFERRPGIGALILEDQTVPQAFIAASLEEPAAPGGQDQKQLLLAKIAQARRVARRLDDDFVDPERFAARGFPRKGRV
jgi:hypothetical protein